ncbi:MAG: hypothetical protein GX070_10365 [Alcaligenaceae bacterium]|nr:hypothetical protein [Alcaligenaceae bacterium]
MTEILLGLNILYEWFLLGPVVPGILFLVLVAFYIMAFIKKPLNWKQGWSYSWKTGLLLGIIAFFVIPMMVDSSVTELKYLPDWLMNIGTSLAVGGYVVLFLWPLLSLKKQKTA